MEPPLSRPSFDEVLAALSELEPLHSTLARFPDLTRDQLIEILRTGSVGEPRPQASMGAAPPKRMSVVRPERAQADGAQKVVRLWTDGASRGNPGPASVGVVIQDVSGAMLEELSERLGVRTNNFAEYEAVRRGLARALDLGATAAELHADSELVIRQLTGVYKVRNPDLLPLFEAVKALERQFPDGVQYRHVRREQNRAADALANLALDNP